MLNLNSQGLNSIQAKIQELILSITGNSKIQQIRQNSIGNLYSKIQAKIVPHDKLPVHLPSILMEWINDHQEKSGTLLKALQIINHYTKTNFGLQVLKQYQALDFFQGFRQYFIRSNPAAKEYQNVLQNIVKKLVPFGYGDCQKQQNASNLGNISKLRTAKQQFPPTQQEAKTSKSKQPVKKHNNQILTASLLTKSYPEQLTFSVLFEELDESIQKLLFDLTVQLRYGNKQVQFKTLRIIKDIFTQNPSAFFRNKVDLIKSLEECLVKKSLEYEAVEVIVIIFKGLVQSSERYKQSLKMGHKVRSIKFVFPLKQSYLEHPIIQPLIQCISNNFKSQWIEWLMPIKSEWVFPYVLNIVKKLEVQVAKSPMVQQLLKTILSSCDVDYQQLEMESIPIDLNVFQNYKVRQSYNELRQFQHQPFNAFEHQEDLLQILDKAELGIEGLSYCPQLVSMYIQIAMCLWLKNEQKQNLGQYHSQAIEMLLKISSHKSRVVRVRLYEILLEKSYIQQAYFHKSSRTQSQIILALLISHEKIVYALMKNAIDQKEHCLIYMMQILKLLYTYHQPPSHNIIKSLAPILKSLDQTAQSNKISNICKHLLSRLTKKQLLSCDALCLFDSDRTTRLNASSQILNFSVDLTEYFQPPKSSKKPLIVDQDCILSYIINAGSVDLSYSVRISALVQLTQSVKRAQMTPLVESRLSSLNERMLKQLIEMVNEENEEQVWMGWVLNLSLQLYLHQLIKSKSLPNVGLLVLMMKVYYSSRCRQLLNALVGMLYVICFQNPFQLDGKPQMHWMYCTGRYVKLIHLNISSRNTAIIHEVLGSHRSLSKNQTPSISDTLKYIQYVYQRLQTQQVFQLKFGQVEQIIGKTLLSNTPEFSFSQIRCLFAVYNQNKPKFKKLSSEFKHLIPPLINYLNKQTSKFVEDDILFILKVIGLQTEKQVQLLLANKKIQIKALELAKQVPPEVLENIIRNLPQQPSIRIKTLKLLIQKKSLKLLKSEIGIISLSSILQKGIKSQNIHLKMISLQGLFIILSQQFLDKNSIFCSLILQQLQNECSNVLCTVLSLRVLKQMIRVNQDATFLGSLQHSQIISKCIQWVNLDRPLMMKAGCLGLLNSIINTPLVQSYDLITTYISQLNFVLGQGMMNQQQTMIKLMIIYESISGILLLSHHTSPEEFINYLLSTQLLYYLLKHLTCFQTIIIPKFNNNFYITKSISSIGSMLLYLSQNQDSFVFHFNKLLQKGTHILKTLSGFIPFAEPNYCKMISRIVSIWNKGHLYLDQNKVGASIIKQVLDVDRDHQNVKAILAVSHSAKQQFVAKGHFKNYVKSALLILEEVLVSKLKSTKPKKKHNSSTQQFVIQKDFKELYKVLNFFKSFFHPNNFQTEFQINMTNDLSEITVDLLQKLYECCQLQRKNTHLLKQFKKVISNLCSSESSWHQILVVLIDPKHSLVNELINNCSRQNPEQLAEGLQLLSIFSRQPEIRTLILRHKLITQLNNRILRNWEQRKDIQQLLELCLSFYLHLSLHQDTQQKIINDKKLLDLIIIQIQTKIQKHESKFPQICLKLLCNLSYSKHNKSLLISNKDLHKTILTVLTNDQVSEELRIYMAHTLYNLLFKSAQAIGIYKKNRVLEDLKQVKEKSGEELGSCLQTIIRVLHAQYN